MWKVTQNCRNQIGYAACAMDRMTHIWGVFGKIVITSTVRTHAPAFATQHIRKPHQQPQNQQRHQKHIHLRIPVCFERICMTVLRQFSSDVNIDLIVCLLLLLPAAA